MDTIAFVLLIIVSVGLFAVITLTVIQDKQFPIYVVKFALIISAVFGTLELQKLADKTIFETSISQYSYETVWIIIGLFFAMGVLIQFLKKIGNSAEQFVSPDLVYPIIVSLLYLPVYFVMKFRYNQLNTIVLGGWGTFSSLLSIMLSVFGTTNHFLNLLMFYAFITLFILSIVVLVINTNKIIDQTNRFLIL